MASAAEDLPDVQAFDEISMIAHGVRAVISGALPVGLSYPQFEVLNLLGRRGDDLTPAQIATALQMTPGAITNTLQRLEALSLVAVAPCATDRRKKRVAMTAKGREAYARSMAAIRPKIDKLRDGFTAQEFRDVLPFLRALRVWMSENR